LTDLAAEVAALGGAGAPPTATARLREVTVAALRHGAAELEKPRSGYEAPVEVVIAASGADSDVAAEGGVAGEGGPAARGRGTGGSPTAAAARDLDGGSIAAGSVLIAATPAAAALRADPEAVGERAWLLVAAAIASLVDLAGLGAPAGPADLCVQAGDLDGFLLVALPGAADPAELDELVPLAFEDHAGGLNRLRARAVAVPGRVLEPAELRAPIGSNHPLRVAEAVARLGARPEDPRSVEQHEEAVLALLQPGAGRAVRPHEDPDPARRVARRILQRLDGMGKWGGYHTDFAHLARGFAGNDRALAQDVGKALLAAGLLAEKPSVGQRHVFLNPRRAAEIHRLIDEGELPPGVQLP
jgi:hypothetical protein